MDEDLRLRIESVTRRLHFKIDQLENEVALSIAQLSIEQSIYNESRINIGVIGESGCGKSTLINAIRGLYANDKYAARVDVKECTKHPTPYPFPNNSNIILWDLPGVNTPDYPLNTYLEKIDSDRYDCFILCSANRFHSTDLVLASKINRRRRQFCFVHLKFDQDIEGRQSKLNRELDNDEIESLMKEIKVDIQNKMIGFILRQPIFVVSAQMVRYKIN